MIFKLVIKVSVFLFCCVLAFFYYCNNNYQFWTHLETDNFNSLIEYEGKQIEAFKGRQILVHKDFKNHIKKIDNYAQQYNLILIINQSFRVESSMPSRPIVLPSNYSNHLAGFAIDFNIKYKGVKYFANDLKRHNFESLPKEIKSFILKIKRDKDLRWGGDFRNEDPVHIDFPLNLKSKNFGMFVKILVMSII